MDCDFSAALFIFARAARAASFVEAYARSRSLFNRLWRAGVVDDVAESFTITLTIVCHHIPTLSVLSKGPEGAGLDIWALLNSGENLQADFVNMGIAHRMQLRCAANNSAFG
jgi:hypothetical protein